MYITEKTNHWPIKFFEQLKNMKIGNIKYEIPYGKKVLLYDEKRW
jgi:hypothetical protein